MGRLAPRFWQDPEVISNITIVAQGQSGIAHIPLSEIAKVRLVSGRATFTASSNDGICRSSD